MNSIASDIREHDASVLVVRKVIRATPERLFTAWTDPDQVRQWWGPEGVSCTHAEIDLRVGGEYRIGNLLPNGTTVWISGEFLEIVPPERLAYTWNTDLAPDSTQRVIVRFEKKEEGTEVVILHELLPDRAMRDRHERGWIGCLAGLRDYAEE